MPGEVGVGIDQSAVVAGELVALLLRECLVLDGDEVLVVPVQDQDVQSSPTVRRRPSSTPGGPGRHSNPRREGLVGPLWR